MAVGLNLTSFCLCQVLNAHCPCFAPPEKRGPSARAEAQTVEPVRHRRNHVVPCIDAKRLGVELAARQNIIDETFELDPGTGKRPEVWPWSGRPNGNIAERERRRRRSSHPASRKCRQAIAEGSKHAGPDVSLGDLREWHALRAWCRNCSHHAEVRSAALIRRYGKGALFSTVEGTWLPGN